MFDDVSVFKMQVWTLISQFLLRTLSYEQDVISAISGILDVSSNGKHHFGLPYYFGSLSDTHFRTSLLWTHKYMPRDQPSCLRRRDAFPSWSWAGWKNWSPTSSMLELSTFQVFTHADTLDISISAGTRGVSLREFYSEQRHHNILTEPSTQCLIIETFLLRITIFDETQNKRLNDPITLDWGLNEPRRWHVKLQNEGEILPQLDYGWVHIVPLSERMMKGKLKIETRIGFLLVARRQVESDIDCGDFGEAYERIGVGYAIYSDKAYRELRRTAWSEKGASFWDSVIFFAIVKFRK